MASAFSIAQLVVGRLVLGVGVGFATQATPLYLSEMAPYNLRGEWQGASMHTVGS